MGALEWGKRLFMGQPGAGQAGMRITLDVAMRVRDVSRTRSEEAAPRTAEPPKPRRGERRRLSKRRGQTG
ncbi:hypothetical protein GCM10010468_59440 [Actinocorallia longicatena]|uniref:Uncharacterized protein n=1 Tax=Actinocorallia longicatena TaxID=111803 RepID=A0ABP6QGS9_9ACTN